MLESWRRNRRRYLTIAAAGAASAAAAYAVYKWWYADTPEEKDSGQPSGSGSRRTAGASTSGSEVLLDPRGPAGAAQMDAEAHLQHHFDSIQGIADSTTLPSLLPALTRALMQAADVEGPLERLRRAKEGTAPLSAADKLACWEQLKVAAFTRALGATWLLPLLDLFVRVQLNILGRHLYLESAVEGSGMQRPQGVPRLSAPSQEQFLSYAEFLAQQGAADLLGMLRQVAARQLAGVALQEALSAERVMGLMQDIAAAFSVQVQQAANAAGGGADSSNGSSGGAGSSSHEGASGSSGTRGWAQFLLPEPSSLRASLAPRVPDNRAMMLGAEAVLVDGEVVEQLVGEAAAVVGGEEFALALQVCNAEVLKAASSKLASSMGSQALPLAKAVPVVAALGSDLLSSALRPPLARLEPVRSLSARVYGCCYLTNS